MSTGMQGERWHEAGERRATGKGGERRTSELSRRDWRVEPRTEEEKPGSELHTLTDSLWDTYKDEYAKDRKSELKIVA